MRYSPLLCLMLMVSSICQAQTPNTAQIVLQNVVVNAALNFNPSGSGCAASQRWDVIAGRCVSAYRLKTLYTTSSCACSCAYGGSCSSQRTGSYPVYGWKVPPIGTELVSSTGSTSWGSCYKTTDYCASPPAPTPPTPPTPVRPPPGSTTQVVSGALICDSSNPLYWLGASSSVNKNKIINAYRNHRYHVGRCPEQDVLGYSGWTHWQAQEQIRGIESVLIDIQNSTNPLSEQIRIVNLICVEAANRAHGSGNYAKSTYINNSGNKCLVTF